MRSGQKPSDAGVVVCQTVPVLGGKYKFGVCDFATKALIINKLKRKVIFFIMTFKRYKGQTNSGSDILASARL